MDQAQRFSPGFRLSTLDVAVLVIGAAGGVMVGWVHVPVGWAIAFVVAHFFLFCNVLRMPRALELAWAGMFASVAVVAAAWPTLWPMAFGAASLCTVVVGVLALRRPSYHGVGWRRVNPRLPAWWRERVEGGQSGTGNS